MTAFGEVAACHRRSIAFAFAFGLTAGLRVAFAAGGPLTYEDVLGLIQKNNISDLAGVIAALPEDFRSSFTLVNSSRSAQSATFESPRVIMFNQNAKLIMTFNGDPSESNYDRLELIQFRDQTNEFEFRAIS